MQANDTFSKGLGRADVDLIGRDTPFQGWYRMDRYRFRHRLFNGGWSEVLTREVFERGHAAGVLPYDPIRDTVVLLEQFRIGAYAAGLENPWMIEIPAGVIEPGESTEDVARREAEEEAALTLGPLVKMMDYGASPGGTSEMIAMYCGRVDSAGVGGLHGLAEENEDIRVFALSFDAAMALLDGNKINNSPCAIALLWLSRHRDRLRSEWS